MSSRRYLDFDLLLEQQADGEYQALVTGSPLGEATSQRFRLPFDTQTLEILLLKLDPGRSGTRRVGANTQQQAAMDFGGPLFEAIFRDDLALAWSRSQDLARQQDAGLRLRLRLTGAPAIAGLPWELLYDRKANAFLAQSERTPLVRYLDVPHVPRPMTVNGPLRVLAIISSPTDLEILDVEDLEVGGRGDDRQHAQGPVDGHRSRHVWHVEVAHERRALGLGQESVGLAVVGAAPGKAGDRRCPGEPQPQPQSGVLLPGEVLAAGPGQGEVVPEDRLERGPPKSMAACCWVLAPTRRVPERPGSSLSSRISRVWVSKGSRNRWLVASPRGDPVTSAWYSPSACCSSSRSKSR